MSLQGRASCPATASDVITHLQGLLLLQRAASHLKLDLTLLRSSRIQQLTQGKEGQTILFQTKTTLKIILISYLLSGSVETVVQICRALQSLPLPRPSSFFSLLQVWIPRHSLINILLHTKLHSSICYPENPTCDI